MTKLFHSLAALRCMPRAGRPNPAFPVPRSPQWRNASSDDPAFLHFAFLFQQLVRHLPDPAPRRRRRPTSRLPARTQQQTHRPTIPLSPTMQRMRCSRGQMSKPTWQRHQMPPAATRCKSPTRQSRRTQRPRMADWTMRRLGPMLPLPMKRPRTKPWLRRMFRRPQTRPRIWPAHRTAVMRASSRMRSRPMAGRRGARTMRRARMATSAPRIPASLALA